MRVYSAVSWVSRKHSDGSEIDGWFIAGITLPTGQVSYHLPDRLWDKARLHAIEECDVAPWDGHTANDVWVRLGELLNY